MSDLTEYANLINQQTAANNSWSAEQAQKQMEFQERMSSTAHQREVADLKAAGLNPVLSANSGASTPTGAMGSTDTSGVQALTDIAIQLSKAQSAQAVANARAANTNSLNNGWNTRNWMTDLALDFYSELTGKDRTQIVQDAAGVVRNIVNGVKENGIVGYAKQILNGSNSGKSVSNTSNNVSGKTNKSYAVTSIDGYSSASFKPPKTYANGTKYRVASYGRKALTS